jgi:hypothetical protein
MGYNWSPLTDLLINIGSLSTSAFTDQIPSRITYTKPSFKGIARLIFGWCILYAGIYKSEELTVAGYRAGDDSDDNDLVKRKS